MPLDNQKELFYWVDEDDNALGAITRAEAHRGNLKIHRAVVVLVFDDQNNILLQQRSMKKDVEPGAWTISCGGHVTYGESYEEAAIHELSEELGIKMSFEPIGKFFMEKDNIEKEWVMMYKITVDHDQTFQVDKDEVESIQWVKITELPQFISDNPFSQCGAKALLDGSVL